MQSLDATNFLNYHAQKIIQIIVKKKNMHCSKKKYSNYTATKMSMII